MKKVNVFSKSAFLTVVAAIAVLSVAIFWQMNRHEYYFEMTVNLETPSGPDSVRSSFRVEVYDTPRFFLEEAAQTWKIYGDAVYFKVKGRPIMFFLISNEYGQDIAITSMKIFDNEFRNKLSDSAKIIDNLPLYYEKELSEEYYPSIVCFEILNDPASVRKISAKEMENIIGVGYRIKSIVIRKTASMSRGDIRKILPWLDQYGQKTLSGSSYYSEEDISHQLMKSNFVGE